MSYRPYLASGALWQMHGLPEQAFKLAGRPRIRESKRDRELAAR